MIDSPQCNVNLPHSEALEHPQKLPPRNRSRWRCRTPFWLAFGPPEIKKIRSKWRSKFWFFFPLTYTILENIIHLFSYIRLTSNPGFILDLVVFCQKNPMYIHVFTFSIYIQCICCLKLHFIIYMTLHTSSSSFEDQLYPMTVHVFSSIKILIVNKIHV